MSSIAVFLILGGGAAFAATKIGSSEIKANAITTGKIKKEAVAAGKIKGGAVTTGKLADAAVTSEKVADNAVINTKIADKAVSNSKLGDSAVTLGKIANEAVASAKLANGAVTASKLGTITVQTETAPVAKEASASVNVDCPAGQRAISGGGAWNEFIKGLSFLSSRPIRSSVDNGQMADGEVAGGWRTSGFNESTTPTSILVWVLCLE
jgi:hypothetical protein